MKKFLEFKIIIPILLGILVFFYYFDLSIIEPSNTAWILNNGGDGAQHYLGSYAFRSDSWHFPVTRTEWINYPEGVSVIYTDGNPLFSIITKLCRGIFPPEYQFYGIWIFMCWILQSVLGYLLVKKLTDNFIYACLAGILFCLLPTQFFRLTHVNLIGLWLILWAIYVFINSDISIPKKQLLFLLIFIISSMLHAYYIFMTFFIALTWYIVIAWDMYKLKQTKLLYRFIIINSIYGVFFILFLWVLGYFYNRSHITSGLDGYGYYSMNVNAPFNPMDSVFSNFINPTPMNGGQYEGIQYFGLGILLLFLYSSVFYIKTTKAFFQSYIGWFILCLLLIPFFIKQGESSITNFDRIALPLFLFFYFATFYTLYKQGYKWLFLLVVPATICFIYALSNIIVWGNVTLFEYKIDDQSFYSTFFRTARSSGRFFWVTALILLLLASLTIYNHAKSKTQNIVILAIIVIVQFLDTSKLSNRLDSNNKERTLAIDSISKEMILSSNRVSFISDFSMGVAEIALLNKKTINRFYIAHGNGTITNSRLLKEDSCFKANLLNPQSLYLFNLRDLPKNNNVIEIYPTFWQGFWAIPPKNFKHDSIRSIFINKVQNDSLETLIKLIQSKDIVIISTKDEGSLKLSKVFTEKFDHLFNTNLKKLGFRNRYFAVFNNGKLIKEELNPDKDIEYSEMTGSVPIFIKSAEKESVISLHDINYSCADRGINFVSLEKTLSGKPLIYTGSFDTYENSYEYK